MDKTPSKNDEDMEPECVRLCNPSVSADMEIDTKKMRGDAIGNTLYSECWVLKILMKLVKFKDEEWNTDMETDVCLLWDMTMEPDVVALLMQHNFLQVSTHILNHTLVPRLMEMLLGIIGNMSCVKEVRNELLSNEDYIDLLIELLSETDALTLIQLMRVLQAMSYDVYKLKVSSDGDQAGEGQNSQAKCSDECLFMQKLMSTKIWIEKTAYLLTSSTNNELLSGILYLLNTLHQIPYRDKLVINFMAYPETVQGILEGLKQMYTERCNDDSSRLEKAICHGTEILASYTSFPAGKEAIGKFKEFISEILYMYLPVDLSPNSMSNDLFIQVLSTMTVIYNLLDAGFFDPLVFNRLLCYLTQIQEREEKENVDSCQEIVERLEQYFKIVVQHSDRDTVAAALQKCSTNQVKVLQAVMET